MRDESKCVKKHESAVDKSSSYMFLRPGAMAEAEGAGSAEAKRRKKEGEDAVARRRTAGRRRKGASTDIRGTAG